jgi:hypothetical protein
MGFAGKLAIGTRFLEMEVTVPAIEYVFDRGI